MKNCGCAEKQLCEICIKNHKGSLYGYTTSMQALVSIPLKLSMKTYDKNGNFISTEHKELHSNDTQ